MAHVHHHAVRNPVIAEWQAHNLALQADNLVATITQVVYVTAGASDAPSSTDTASPSLTSTQTIQLSLGASASTSSHAVYSAPPRQVRPESSMTLDSSTSTSFTSSIPATQTTLVSSTIPTSLLVAATSSAFASSSNVADAASSSPTATPQSSGMSGGAKAGLAIGILLVLALVAATAFFFVRRKKQAEADEHQRSDDEKSEMRQRPHSVSSHVTARGANVNAPRLSLRPLTQLFTLGSEKQDASALAAESAAAPRAHTFEPEAPMSNPFGDHAAEKSAIATPAAAAISVPSSNASDRTLSNLSEHSNPAEGQAFPTVVAGSRRNSPPGPGPNNVHRVQLDFKPSMEDELELRAGSLVRMLHEYDDGWALCIRLDRSQQGVVPRTCISKLPVKPRPQGPPPPNMRAGPPGRPNARPNGPPRGPPSAGRMRSQSNAPGQQQRPQSPALAQQAQQGRPRSNSDAGNGALPVRKPVPGQAM